MSTLIIKSGTTSIQGSTVKGSFSYYSGDTTHDLGQTSSTGFYSGINAPNDGFSVYQIGGSQGWTVRVANSTTELNSILLQNGATGSTVDQNITWATNTDSMYINSGLTTTPLIMTINTTTTNRNVLMPYYTGFTYSGTINWGDGNTSANAYGANHTYLSAGTYTVTVSGAIGKFNTFYHTTSTLPSYLISITQFGNQFSFGSDIGGYFGSCTRLTSVASDIPINGITNMSFMFNQAYVFNQNINSWNVSNVTNMNGMFYEASTFNGSIISWDVSKVTNMVSMFWFATYFNQNIGSWNVSGVTNMTYMFYHAESFNQNISSWNVSKVTATPGMFLAAINFNQNIGSWNVSGVTNMAYMFASTYYFDQDLGSWNVSKVTDMTDMFGGAAYFNQNIGSWNVSGVTSMVGMFANASAFDQDLGSWNVSNVTNMDSMFQQASSFTGLNIGNWDVSSVTNMNSMFSYTQVNQDIGGWHITYVTTMENMFYDNFALDSTNLTYIYNGWGAWVNNYGGQYGVPFYAIPCYSSDASYNRSLLTAGYPGWVITDGGVCP
jgi:surface protein